MADGSHLIAGQWLTGAGAPMESQDPASGECLWRGAEADADQVAVAVGAARQAFPDWAATPLDDRIATIEAFAARVEDNKGRLAETIARETGKPLWDASGEAGAVAAKIGISVKAYHERTGRRESATGGIRQRLAHRPHGVLAVYGPFNFPAHLPNGHIVPALLAGNTVVFKPSELTPWTAELMARLWQEAGLPNGALNLVQGGKDTGIALSASDNIDGILFTGSVATGKALHRQTAGMPGRILALEMGGNNPLVVGDVADAEAAALLIAQSAYASSGQRCTCARRLILPDGPSIEPVLEALRNLIGRIRVGVWNDDPEPFMGPLISAAAAEHVLDRTADMLERGSRAIVPPVRLEQGDAFLGPGLIDVTDVADRPDDEIFGPVLQVIRVPDFDAALAEANATRFGLAAGLISDDSDQYRRFRRHIRAGIVNWNRPTTGASSSAPFGGVGLSGNHRPSAWYAADYCAYPVAGLEDAANRVSPAPLPRGIEDPDVDDGDAA